MLKEPIRRPTDRQQVVQRTPAMAIGIADHIFSVAELACSPVFPPGVGDNHT